MYIRRKLTVCTGGSSIDGDSHKAIMNETVSVTGQYFVMSTGQYNVVSTGTVQCCLRATPFTVLYRLFPQQTRYLGEPGAFHRHGRRL